MNAELIREIVKSKKITLDELSKEIGVDRSTLYRKLENDGETFKVSEMKKLISTLDLTPEDVNRIFFG